jgi:hypothetical protein
MKAEKDMAALEDGQILRLRYEDFVDNPISDLERICAHCGLEMTSNMVNAAREMVKSDRKIKWQRFDPRDLARIIPEIRAEMQRHGYEIPAEIAQAIQNLPQDEQPSWRPALNEPGPELSPSQIESQV